MKKYRKVEVTYYYQDFRDTVIVPSDYDDNMVCDMMEKEHPKVEVNTIRDIEEFYLHVEIPIKYTN